MRNALQLVWDVIVFVSIMLIGLVFFLLVGITGWTQHMRRRGRITL